MAGLTPKLVREALQKQLANNLSRDVGVHAYAPLLDVREFTGYPAILISHAPESTDYALTFGSQGIAEMHLLVEAFTDSPDGVSAEMALDDLFAAGSGASSSVYDALMSDVTLGGLTHTLRVVDVRAPRSLGDGRWSAGWVIAVCQARS